MSGGHDAALSVMGHIRYPIILRMWNIGSATLQEEFGGIRVLKRLTQLLSELKGIRYKKKLDRFGFLSLECRKLREDLI